MKALTLKTMILFLSLAVLPTTVLANSIEPTTTTSALAPNGAEVPAEVKVMYDRLEEIKNMDKSDLSSSDRKALRKEVRAIKSSLKASGNGVYLSVGAIIIIILLLIIIL